MLRSTHLRKLGNVMKLRFSGSRAPRTLSAVLIASALCFTSVILNTAHADTATMCYRLTPAEITKMTDALNTAQATADATTTVAGYDPNSPSAYPNAEIRYAKSAWQTELNYIAEVPVTYTQPYITASNVALSLEVASIDMMYWLQHGRYWATAMAYNYSVTNQPLAQRYLETRRDIAAAIDAIQVVAHLGSRCAVGQSFASPTLPNP
jgi:hypothetical protein